MARFVLLASAIAFGGIGAAFLFFPQTMAARIGIDLTGAIADHDILAVYGGLEIGIAVFLATCAARPAWFRPGLIAQILFFGGLALGRAVGWFSVGHPGTLGIALHAAEIVALVLGLIAWRRLSATV